MDQEKLAELHRLIDDWAGVNANGNITFTGTDEAPEAPLRVLPTDRRVVRTKSTGDNVYEVNETTKTKRWVRNPEVLKALGWEMEDVVEVDPKDLIGYTMGPSIYQVDEA